MNLTRISDGLWQIDEVYPAELISDCQQQDITSIPWVPLGDEKYTQEHLPRHVLTPTDGVFLELNTHIGTLLPKIREVTGVLVTDFYTDIWADYPGYTLPMHIDNEAIYVSMQVYLNSCDTYLGTSFGDYKIPYIVNTGYLMVNNTNMYHGMLNAVPEDFVRLSSYTRFLR